MADTWLLLLWEVSLTLTVLLSTILTIVLLTLPSPYNPRRPHVLTEANFNSEAKQNAAKSGYTYFIQHKDAQGRLAIETSVQIVVLGDIGRSPRMQYHALSIAAHGGLVDLIGYEESEVHPDIKASRLINVIPIHPFPRALQTQSKILFLLLAPLKVFWQAWSLYQAVGYRAPPCRWMLVQNPPSIPTLAIAQFISFVRNSFLIIDWHNFGYSILALRLGPRHPLVRISEVYEKWFSARADCHFAVTDAMARVLKDRWSLEARTLHDRPPTHFQPLSSEQRLAVLSRLPEIAQYASEIAEGSWRLVVSSTSWTADEDFSLLLNALTAYSSSVEDNPRLPSILTIITGKGPQKEFYLSRIRELNQQNKLKHVVIITAWLSTEDYAALLGSADLGISLHTSSSGVDLPMKVVDMFGTGLPVAGWNKFEAWSELVREGKNGRGFESAEGLARILEEVFGGSGTQLQRLREGAVLECERRWEDEWMPVAGALMKLK